MAGGSSQNVPEDSVRNAAPLWASGEWESCVCGVKAVTTVPRRITLSWRSMVSPERRVPRRSVTTVTCAPRAGQGRALPENGTPARLVGAPPVSPRNSQTLAQGHTPECPSEGLATNWQFMATLAGLAPVGILPAVPEEAHLPSHELAWGKSEPLGSASSL